MEISLLSASGQSTAELSTDARRVRPAVYALFASSTTRSYLGTWALSVAMLDLQLVDVVLGVVHLEELPTTETDQNGRTATEPIRVRSWIRFIRARRTTSGGSRLNFLTDLSGSGRARPIGAARTGPTSSACASVRSSREMSERPRGETVRTGIWI